MLAHEHLDAIEMRKVLVKTSDRLEQESRRAQQAEARAREVEARAIELAAQHKIFEQHILREQDLRRAYEAQVQVAKQEIIRAQKELDSMAASKHRAEEEAARERSHARQVRQEVEIQRALEAGRQQGYNQGYDRGIRHGRRRTLDQLRGMGIADGVVDQFPPPPGQGDAPSLRRSRSGSAPPIGMPIPVVDGRPIPDGPPPQFPRPEVNGVPISDGPPVQFPRPEVNGVPIPDGATIHEPIPDLGFSNPPPMGPPQDSFANQPPMMPTPNQMPSPSTMMPQPQMVNPLPMTIPGGSTFVPQGALFAGPDRVPSASGRRSTTGFNGPSMPVPNTAIPVPQPPHTPVRQPSPLLPQASMAPPSPRPSSQNLRPEAVTNGRSSPRPQSRAVSRQTSRRSLASALDFDIPTATADGIVLPPPHAMAEGVTSPRSPSFRSRSPNFPSAPLVSVDVNQNSGGQGADVSIKVHQPSPTRNQAGPSRSSNSIHIPNVSVVPPDPPQPPSKGSMNPPQRRRGMGRYDPNNPNTADGDWDFAVESADSSEFEDGPDNESARRARGARSIRGNPDRSLSTIIEVSSVGHTPEPQQHHAQSRPSSQQQGFIPPPLGRNSRSHTPSQPNNLRGNTPMRPASRTQTQTPGRSTHARSVSLGSAADMPADGQDVDGLLMDNDFFAHRSAIRHEIRPAHDNVSLAFSPI